MTTLAISKPNKSLTKEILVLFIMAVSVMIVSVTSTTLAYLTRHTDPVTNMFTPYVQPQ